MIANVSNFYLKSSLATLLWVMISTTSGSDSLQQIFLDFSMRVPGNSLFIRR